MITIISPSKKLYDTPKKVDSKPQTSSFLEDTLELADLLKTYSRSELEKLLHISPKLAELNYDRYQAFSSDFSKRSSQAVFSFSGTVYDGLDANSLSNKEIHFANEHLRHLSGLFGLLRPLDLIQAYRLDMGTKLITKKGKNLYEFWGNKITDELNSALEETPSKTVINLASKEYSKAIKVKNLNGRFLTLDFKEKKDGQYKAVMTYAKFARGLMARYIIQNQAQSPEVLKSFTEENYAFNEDLSTEDTWIFSR